jgi:hypothetical protein
MIKLYEHLARMEEMKNSYKTLVKKPTGTGHLRDQSTVRR